MISNLSYKNINISSSFLILFSQFHVTRKLLNCRLLSHVSQRHSAARIRVYFFPSDGEYKRFLVIPMNRNGNEDWAIIINQTASTRTSNDHNIARVPMVLSVLLLSTRVVSYAISYGIRMAKFYEIGSTSILILLFPLQKVQIIYFNW